MTTTVHDEARALGPPAEAARAPTHLFGVTAPELCVLGVALLLPLAFAVQDFTTFFMPKVALLLLLLGLGSLRPRAGLPASGSSSWWAAAFLAVSALSTLFADVPILSVFGSYAWGNGLLFVAALVAFWALGRMLGSRARELLVIVLLFGALVNAGWAWLQMSVDLGESVFRPYLGRAPGLMGNPVQLGALCAAAMWLAAGKTRSRLVPWLIALAVLAGAVQLSGSRIALVAGIGAVVFAASRAGLRRGCLIGGAVALGIVLSMLVPAPGGSSTQRVTGATSQGLGPRVALWESAAHGLTDRPLIGFGPGRFYVAATPHTSLTTARYTGGDTLYADAHNFVVEFATTTGLLGLIALGGFLIVAGRRARGPLVGFTIVVAITMLLQPQYVGLTPLVLLALGASGPRLRLFPASGVDAERPVDRGTGRMGAGRVILVVLCGATALVGGVVGYRAIAGDAAFERAVTERSPAQVDRADRLFPAWPDVPAQRASIYATRRFLTGERRYEALAARSGREAVERDPSDPQWLFQMGNLEEASHAFRIGCPVLLAGASPKSVVDQRAVGCLSGRGAHASRWEGARDSRGAVFYRQDLLPAAAGQVSGWAEGGVTFVEGALADRGCVDRADGAAPGAADADSRWSRIARGAVRYRWALLVGVALLVSLRATGHGHGDWDFFADASRRLFGESLPSLPKPGGLHLYASYPDIVTGPISLLSVPRGGLVRRVRGLCRRRGSRQPPGRRGDRDARADGDPAWSSASRDDAARRSGRARFLE